MSETEKKTEEKKKISSRVKTPAQAGAPAQKSAAAESAAAPASSPSKQPPAAAKAAAPKPAAAKAAAPKSAAAKAAAPKASGSLRIRQIKSGICAPVDQKQTLLGLGLRRIRHEVVRLDTPTVRGQVHKVRHLVEIVEAGAAR
jgi:large subunit ribosomal protein L30